MMRTFLIWVVLVAAACADPSVFEPFEKRVGAAVVSADGDELEVSTGVVARRWRWTGQGLITVGLCDLRSEIEWVEQSSDKLADWDFAECTSGNATLVSLKARASTDEGFTSEHLEVEVVMAYTGSGVELKYIIWAYPEAPGLRTQIWLKGAERNPGSSRSNGAAVGVAVERGSRHVIPAHHPEFSRVPAYHSSNLHAANCVKLKLMNMKRGRAYRAGVTWWDSGAGQRRTQSIDALSMDGESVVQVVPAVVLPSARDGALPEAVTFGIPDEIRVGDMVRIAIRKERGVNANLCEFWAYEEGAAPENVTFAGDQTRIAELAKKAPEGFFLAAYLDCGAPLDSKPKRETDQDHRVDFLPLSGGEMTAFGYFNDTQHRHTERHHMCREERVDGPVVDWASALFFESKKQCGGVALVKESHKCVNRSGVRTGSFVCDSGGVQNTGAALALSDLTPDSFLWCWASWCVLYPESTDFSRQLAMKQFDRARYPVDLERDVFVKANTWGSGNSSLESVAMASEEAVLSEIASVADLGIDVLQIDDGWQTGRQDPTNKEQVWHVRGDWYSAGWGPVCLAAHAAGVRLGLWTAAYAELSDLKRNFDSGGFVTWKYDFASIKDYQDLYGHWAKLRAFLKYTQHRARMAVDVTENAPRFGYFWARDFGCVWLSNRKPEKPENTIPKPTLMLRENRELSKYMNLNKFELPIQNFQRVNRKKSDAYRYGHSYEVALGLMGIPTFFQTTSFYQGAARAEVRSLVALYKKEQKSLYERYVFPIAGGPDGAAWSGFQWLDPRLSEGYILLFRERNSVEAAQSVTLFDLVAGQRLALFDLRSGASSQCVVGPAGKLSFRIEQAADFCFLKYIKK